MSTPATNVTTTSTIEGWEIHAHLGVVAAHVVAGTGLMSEFFAGFSDIFGGRSGSYQNQLGSIYAEALKYLLRQAGERGGNWIVGLSVDFDEISGKGTQMFMVSATGTAVRAERIARPSARPKMNGRLLAATDLEVMGRRLVIADAVNQGRLILDDATWGFIVENHVEEALPAVLQWLGERLSGTAFDQLEFATRQRPLAYVRGLPPEVASQRLYEVLGGDEVVAKAALALLRAAPLVQLEATLAALSGSEVTARRAVQALKAHQPVYGPADLGHIDALIEAIPRAFPVRSERTTTKGLLGAKERWTCGFCSESGNGRDDILCKRCARDAAGFGHGDLTASVAVTLLAERRRALATLLNGAG